MNGAQPGIDFTQLRTLGDIARYHAKQRPDAIAFSFEGRDTSFAQFDRHSGQVACRLIAAGIAPGDRIAYVGKNSDYFFEILFGAAKCGAVLTSIGWRLSPVEIANMLDDSKARFVFVGPEIQDQVLQAVAGLNHPVTFIALESGQSSDQPIFPEWRDEAYESSIDIAIDEEAVVLQLYTSGTTGRPKGAMLAHRSILGVRRLTAGTDLAWNQWSPEDVALAAMPVGHVGGSVWGVVALLNGAKSIVAREFDPLKVLDYIEHDGISKIFLVPSALRIIVNQKRARQVNYSRLKYMLYGSSPMPLDLLRECMQVFGCGFVQTYGMTETAGTIVYLPPEDHDPAGNKRMRAAGIPLPGVELRIADTAGGSLPPYAVGEVVTRSAANMVGYWGLPQATSDTIDRDGWLHTGDAGYLDEDGYLYISDRIKDMIITGAENVYPAEVENAIHGHPAVNDVAVIGVPDPKWGEAVKAIVVLQPNAAADAAEIIAFARTRIAAFKVPKSVDFIEILPRNAAGKILRRQLREPFWAGLDRRVN